MVQESRILLPHFFLLMKMDYGINDFLVQIQFIASPGLFFVSFVLSFLLLVMQPTPTKSNFEQNRNVCSDFL